MTNKTLPKTHARILASIPVGADSHLVTGRELAEMHNMNLRGVQAIIQLLIIEYGVPICASRDTTGGCYIPANDTERLEGVRALYSQQQEEEKRITVLMNSSLKEHERYLKGGA